MEGEKGGRGGATCLSFFFFFLFFSSLRGIYYAIVGKSFLSRAITRMLIDSRVINVGPSRLGKLLHILYISTRFIE